MPPMSFKGLVTKVGFMKKTATVTVTRIEPHPRTGKLLERSKKFLTHDEHDQLRQGDMVLIRNCPPISARKRFILEEIIKSPEGEREKAHAKISQREDESSQRETAASAAAESGAAPEAPLATATT